MNKFRQYLSRLWSVLLSSVNRFPETILISLAYVVVMIVNNRWDNGMEDQLTMIAMILALGIPLSATMKLIIERFKLPYLYRGVMDLVLALYGGLFWYWRPNVLDDRFMIRYAVATGLGYLIFTLIAYLWERKGYSKYCVKLLVSFFVTYLYTLVLYLGVIAIVFAVDFLFELSISDKIYFDTFIAAIGVFGLTYFLGKVPGVGDGLESYRYPTVLRVLFVSIVIPLISVYTLVLYAYFLRVIVSVGWDGSFVSQLVIWYGFVSIALLILLDPLKENSKVVQNFLKFYPVFMAVPLAMLFISMVIRINSYGLTVPRGLVMLSWAWFSFSVIYVMLRKGEKLQWLSGVAVLVFAVGTFAPFNVFALSDSIQISKLTSQLENLGMLENNRLIPRTDLPDEEIILISDRLSYLEEYRGLHKVDFLPNEFTLEDMESVFGFTFMTDRYYVDEYGQSYVNYYMNSGIVTDISEYRYHVNISSRSGDEISDSMAPVNVYDDEGHIIVDLAGQIVYDAAIEEVLAMSKIPVTYNRGDEPVIIDLTEKWGKMRLVFTEIGGRIEKDVLEVNYYRAEVFVALNEGS